MNPRNTDCLYNDAANLGNPKQYLELPPSLVPTLFANLQDDLNLIIEQTCGVAPDISIAELLGYGCDLCD